MFYGCESGTLTTDQERRIQAFEHKCYRRLLGASYREHKTNEYVRQQISVLAKRQEFLLSIVKRRKLSWFGHICRQSTLPKVIGNGTAEGCRHKGRSLETCKDNISEFNYFSKHRPTFKYW